MENGNIETRVESEDPLVGNILQPLLELQKRLGIDVTLSLAMELHEDPVSGYNPKKEMPEKLTIRDESGKERPILSVYN